jgi:hypothetical protein
LGIFRATVGGQASLDLGDKSGLRAESNGRQNDNPQIQPRLV